MQEVAATELQPGMIVGKTIRQSDDRILLNRGVALDERLISLLQARGLGSIWVTTVAEAAIGPIEERVQVMTRKHLERLFQIALEHGPVNAKLKNEADKLLFQLQSDVEAIMADVASGPLSPRLGSLNSHHQPTFEHCIDVGIVSAVVARKLYLDLQTTRSLTMGALVHDIGKLKISPEILNKPGPLTPEEWDLMRQHPEIGAEMIRALPLDDPVPATVALQHHEQQNGQGYPSGRRGTNRIWRDASAQLDYTRIHLAAEIVTVANAFVSLTSDHPYRKALSLEESVATLRDWAGPKLNRQVTEALLTLAPSFPLGTPVRLIGGKYHGYRGVVVRITDENPARPSVRLLSDSWGERIRPIEVDTAADDEVEVRAALGVLETAGAGPAGL